jgi:hypothetical protein
VLVNPGNAIAASIAASLPDAALDAEVTTFL